MDLKEPVKVDLPFPIKENHLWQIRRKPVAQIEPGDWVRVPYRELQGCAGYAWQDAQQQAKQRIKSVTVWVEVVSLRTPSYRSRKNHRRGSEYTSRKDENGNYVSTLVPKPERSSSDEIIIEFRCPTIAEEKHCPRCNGVIRRPHLHNTRIRHARTAKKVVATRSLDNIEKFLAAPPISEVERFLRD